MDSITRIKYACNIRSQGSCVADNEPFTKLACDAGLDTGW